MTSDRSGLSCLLRSLIEHATTSNVVVVLVAGLSDVKNACCGGGAFGAKVQCGARGYKVCKRVDRSFFWDNLHPTEAVIKEKFNLFWNGSPGYIKPISIMALAKLPIPH